MPLNRNAIIRYQVLDKCLRNRGRKWTWQDLLSQVNEALYELNYDGIGKTTLYEDLKDIETRIYRIEIERIKDGKTTYLRYANPEKSINESPLSDKEAEQIRSAIMVLSRFKGMPQFEWISEIIPVIESKIGLINNEKEIISFDSNIDYSGAKHIPSLFNAILNKRALRLTYQDFKSPIAYELEVHPQYLKQYNSRWFLMSLRDEYENSPQIHSLDRIKDIEEVKTSYKELIDYDWDNYFSDMIGVTRFNKEPVEIKILIMDSEQASYIDTKPLHQSQKKIKKSHGGYETSITVIPNYELIKLILSFGERIMVLSPIEVVQVIRLHINNMQKLYPL